MVLIIRNVVFNKKLFYKKKSKEVKVLLVQVT